MHLREHTSSIPPNTVVIEQRLNLPHRRNGNILIPDLPLRKVQDILLGDPAHDPLNLRGVHPAASGDDLSADILRHSRGPVEGEQQGCLQLGFCALDLRLGDGLGQAGPLAEGKVDEVVNLGDGVGDEVDPPEAGVGVRGAEGHEAVCELVLVDERAELAAQMRGVAHGAVPVADDGLRDERGEVVRVFPGDALDCDGDVRGGEGVVPHADLGADEVWAGAAGGPEGDLLRGGLERAKVLLGEVDELLVGDASGGDEDHAVGFVVLADVVGEVGALDGEDVFLGAEDGTAEGLALECGGVEVVKDDFFELAVDFLLLADDDVSFSLNGVLFDFGVLDDVGEDLDCFGGVVLEGFGVVDGVLAL